MTPANIKRRRDALRSAVVNTLLRLIAAAALLWCRRTVDSAFVSVLLVVTALLNLGTIVPIWICLHTRLKEIEGGEEDAAAEY